MTLQEEETPDTNDNDTLGVATAFQKDGDTLQSATTAVRGMGLSVERFFDQELGIVIGEKTPLMPVRETRKMGEGRESIAARRVVTICDVRHGLGRK